MVRLLGDRKLQCLSDVRARAATVVVTPRIGVQQFICGLLLVFLLKPVLLARCGDTELGPVEEVHNSTRSCGEMDHDVYDNGDDYDDDYDDDVETQTRRLKCPSVKNQGHCTRKGTRGIILVTFRSPQGFSVSQGMQD